MTQPCRSPYCECDTNKCTHPGFHDARDLMEEPKMNNPNTLQTTQVTTYIATDGSLWLNEDECLGRNQELSSELYEHIYHKCLLDDTSCYTTETIAEYIIKYFDKIKTLLGK